MLENKDNHCQDSMLMISHNLSPQKLLKEKKLLMNNKREIKI